MKPVTIYECNDVTCECPTITLDAKGDQQFIIIEDDFRNTCVLLVNQNNELLHRALVSKDGYPDAEMIGYFGNSIFLTLPDIEIIKEELLNTKEIELKEENIKKITTVSKHRIKLEY